MKGGVVIMVGFVALTVMMVKPGEAITCGQVDSLLAPCLPYLTTGTGKPAPACCEGVTNLKKNTPTTTDRRAACQCIKDAASKYETIKPDAASQLPRQCGVEVGVPISKDVNCDNVNYMDVIDPVITYKDIY